MQKLAQNDKKLCLSCFISQEPYIIWSSFLIIIWSSFLHISSFFYIFSNFLFLGSIVVCHIPYLSKHTSCDFVFWYTCKMMTSQDGFFISLKFWFSWLLGRKYGKKWCKMTKNSVSHSVSQEPYLSWLWVLVHLGKMMICPAIFLIFFKILIFWVFRGEGKRAKNDP